MPSREDLLCSAIDAVRSNRPDVTAILRSLPIPDDPPATSSPEEVWLAAERAYRTRLYRQAEPLFSRFESDPRSARLPEWMRYLSLHRRAWAQFQGGRLVDCSITLARAEKLVRASDALAHYSADIDAMRAHVAELKGDLGVASALFDSAYQTAVLHEYWARARTVASDLGRLALIQAEPSRALTWLARVRETPGEAAEPFVLRTARLREALALGTLERNDLALGILDELVATHQDGGELLVDVLTERARVHATLGRIGAATCDLERAAEVARTGALVRHEMYARKEMAALLFNAGRLARSRAAFHEALGLCLRLEGLPVLALSHLLEDVLARPRMVRESVPMQTLERVERLLMKLGAFARTGTYQRTTRATLLRKTVGDAKALLGRLNGTRANLAHGVVDFGASTFSAEGVMRSLTPGEMDLLRELLAHEQGCSTKSLALRFEKSDQAVQQDISRLRRKIGKGNLVTIRRGPGRHAIHRLNFRVAVVRSEAPR